MYPKKLFFFKKQKRKTPETGEQKTQKQEKAKKGINRRTESNIPEEKVGFCGREFRSKKGERIGRKLKEFL